MPNRQSVGTVGDKAAVDVRVRVCVALARYQQDQGQPGFASNKKADLRECANRPFYIEHGVLVSHGSGQTVNCGSDEMALNIAGGRCFHAL